MAHEIRRREGPPDQESMYQVFRQVAPLYWNESTTIPGLVWAMHFDDYKLAFLPDRIVGPFIFSEVHGPAELALMWNIFHTDPVLVETFKAMMANSEKDFHESSGSLRRWLRKNQRGTISAMAEAIPRGLVDGQGRPLPDIKDTIDLHATRPEHGLTVVLASGALEPMHRHYRFAYTRTFPHGVQLRSVYDDTIIVGLVPMSEYVREMGNAKVGVDEGQITKAKHEGFRLFESPDPMLLYNFVVWSAVNWQRLREAALTGFEAMREVLLEWPSKELVKDYMPGDSEAGPDDFEYLDDLAERWAQENDSWEGLEKQMELEMGDEDHPHEEPPQGVL